MNDNIEILESRTLSDDWYLLKKYTVRQRGLDGSWLTQQREVYDRGNGATILLYNPERRSVVLTRQFRLPTFVNGNRDGLLIETCAGLLDGEDPERAVVRETEEETGYRVSHVEKIFEAYMSPGSVTEILHFYLGRFDNTMKTSAGGGVEDEGTIEVLELPFDDAWQMTVDGRIRDGKTIMLLQHAKLSGLCGKPS